VDLVDAVDDFGAAIDDLPDDVVVDGTVDWTVPPIPMPPGPRSSQPTGDPQSGPGDPSYRSGTPALAILSFGKRPRVVRAATKRPCPKERSQRRDVALVLKGCAR